MATKQPAAPSQVIRIKLDEALLILARLAGVPEARELTKRIARLVSRMAPNLPGEVILAPRLYCPVCGHRLVLVGGRAWLECSRAGCKFQGRVRGEPRVDPEVRDLLLEIEREIRATIAPGGTDPTGTRKPRPRPKPGDFARGIKLD